MRKWTKVTKHLWKLKNEFFFLRTRKINNKINLNQSVYMQFPYLIYVLLNFVWYKVYTEFIWLKTCRKNYFYFFFIFQVNTNFTAVYRSYTKRKFLDICISFTTIAISSLPIFRTMFDNVICTGFNSNNTVLKVYIRETLESCLNGTEVHKWQFLKPTKLNNTVV